MSRTSQAWYHGAACPAWVSSAISGSPPAGLVPQKATLQPCAAKARTSYAPMPDDPPEMKTVRPLSEG